MSFAAEMVTYLPIASPFIRLGGFWVDDAWGFAMGWNYFFLMGKCLSLGPLYFPFPPLTEFYIPAFNIPYEITAVNVLLTYWTDKIPVVAVVFICFVLYAYVTYPSRSRIVKRKGKKTNLGVAVDSTGSQSGTSELLNFTWPCSRSSSCWDSFATLLSPWLVAIRSIGPMGLPIGKIP